MSPRSDHPHRPVQLPPLLQDLILPPPELAVEHRGVLPLSGREFTALRHLNSGTQIMHLKLAESDPDCSACFTGIGFVRGVDRVPLEVVEGLLGRRILEKADEFTRSHSDVDAQFSAGTLAGGMFVGVEVADGPTAVELFSELHASLHQRFEMNKFRSAESPYKAMHSICDSALAALDNPRIFMREAIRHALWPERFAPLDLRRHFTELFQVTPSDAESSAEALFRDGGSWAVVVDKSSFLVDAPNINSVLRDITGNARSLVEPPARNSCARSYVRMPIAEGSDVGAHSLSYGWRLGAELPPTQVSIAFLAMNMLGGVHTSPLFEMVQELRGADISFSVGMEPMLYREPAFHVTLHGVPERELSKVLNQLADLPEQAAEWLSAHQHMVEAFSLNPVRAGELARRASTNIGLGLSCARLDDMEFGFLSVQKQILDQSFRLGEAFAAIADINASSAVVVGQPDAAFTAELKAVVAQHRAPWLTRWLPPA